MDSRETKRVRRTNGAKTFARVSWRVGDVLSCFDVTPEEASEFLARHEGEIQERTIERGWEVLDTLGRIDGLTRRDDEEPDDEEGA